MDKREVDALPLFYRSNRCAKCENEAKYTWDIVRGLMRRDCLACGHFWYERAKDAATKEERAATIEATRLRVAPKKESSA